MRGLTLLLTLIVANIAMIAAQNQFERFPHTTASVRYASATGVAGTADLTAPDDATARQISENICSAKLDCIGVLLLVGGLNQYTYFLLTADGTNDFTGSPGTVKYLTWKYRANPATGPTCSARTGDKFTSISGQCSCGSNELQDPRSNFGCVNANGSPVSRRRQLALDKRIVGEPPMPYFQQLRSPKRRQSTTSFTF